MLYYSCPTCNNSLKVAGELVGQKVLCPSCGQRLKIPSPAQNKTVLAVPEPAPRPRRASAGVGPRWHYTCGGTPATDPVSWEELGRMAQAGALLPDDLAKEEGDSGWVRADSLPGLFLDALPAPEEEKPPVAPAGRPNRLSPCESCGQPVAHEADLCLTCGAPNHWMHPRVARFLEKTRQGRFKHISGFEAEGRHYVLVGRSRSTGTRQFLGVAAGAVGSLGFIGPMSLAGLATILAASVGREYAAQALRDAAGHSGEAFVLDFRGDKPAWHSTDDEHWAEIMEIFKLRID